MRAGGQGADFGANEPRVIGPPKDGERDQRMRERRTERHDYGDRQDRRRKGKEEVCDSHQQVVDPAAIRSGD